MRGDVLWQYIMFSVMCVVLTSLLVMFSGDDNGLRESTHVQDLHVYL